MAIEVGIFWFLPLFFIICKTVVTPRIEGSQNVSLGGMIVPGKGQTQWRISLTSMVEQQACHIRQQTISRQKGKVG